MAAELFRLMAIADDLTGENEAPPVTEWDISAYSEITAQGLML